MNCIKTLWPSDSTKPLPEPMLTCHQWAFLAFAREQFHECPIYYSVLMSLKILLLKITASSPRDQWFEYKLLCTYSIKYTNNHIVGQRNKELPLGVYSVTGIPSRFFFCVTHWGRDKMATILKMAFSTVCLNFDWNCAAVCSWGSNWQ